MSREGLIGYETLIEHHKKHHVDEDALRAKLELAKEAIKNIRLNINSGNSALFSTEIIHSDNAKFYINRAMKLADEALQKLED